MMIQCKDCRFWRTAERQGHFAPCGLHDLPHGIERGDYETWESDYRSPWMPDLGGCLGFDPRVAAEHWMYCKPRGRSFQSIPAIKVVRVYGGLTLADAKRWVEMCMALGRKQIAISLILKDFDGFRKEMATHGFEVRPALPPVAKKRKKHT
jgi:hypothetical protein